MRSNEVVVTSQKLNMIAELVHTCCVRYRSPAQIRGALTNREIQALDERGIQSFGIFRLQQRVCQATRGTDLDAPLDPDDTVVPPSLDHLTVDARGPMRRTITLK